MRCLTLADALSQRGMECRFVCRPQSGDLINHIRGKGYEVYELPTYTNNLEKLRSFPALAHANWLGTTQECDAADCRKILSSIVFDWLVVDHYALDARWEISMKANYQNLMVIDDLADRPHECDLLLDQNLGQLPGDYTALVPEHCRILAGAEFALLRPEFSELRLNSLSRRATTDAELKNILVTMGGVDVANTTAYVLQALNGVVSPSDHISVVMGSSAPWLNEIRQLANNLSCTCEVLVNTSDMAKLMANSDLAIGAAGSTSWERCCMGLPTLIAVAAENQRVAAKRLEEAEAAFSFSIEEKQATSLQLLFRRLKSAPTILRNMSRNAASITSGYGCKYVIKNMLEIHQDG